MGILSRMLRSRRCKRSNPYFLSKRRSWMIEIDPVSSVEEYVNSLSFEERVDLGRAIEFAFTGDESIYDSAYGVQLS